MVRKQEIYRFIVERGAGFLSLFSSEKKLSDRLFFMAFYLCLGLLPPLIGVLNNKSVTAPFLIISLLVVLRFFMRKKSRDAMIAQFRSPGIILLLLFSALLLFHASTNIEVGQSFFQLLEKPLMLLLIVVLLSFVWSHHQTIDKRLLLQLAMIGFWAGLAITLLKISVDISLGFGESYQNSILTSLCHIDNGINRVLVILALLAFLAFGKNRTIFPHILFLSGLYLAMFVLTFFTAGFTEYQGDMVMVRVASETLQFGIPLALLILILSWKWPRQMVHFIFASFLLVLLGAPWLFQAWYWILRNAPYLPKPRKLLVRGEIWDGAAQRALESPFFGAGIDSIRYGKNLDLANQYMPTDNLSHPHNMVLQLWLDMGLAGIVIIVGLVFLGWQFVRKIDTALMPAFLSALVILCVVVLVSHSIWQIWSQSLIVNIFILMKMQGYGKTEALVCSRSGEYSAE